MEIAYRLTGQPEDVEEIVNDLWLRVWESIPPQKPESLRHYLAKLTRNLAFDLLREAGGERFLPEKMAFQLSLSWPGAAARGE